MSSGEKILVTGGAGFIGSNLIRRLLSEGYEVVCLDNFITGKRENVFEFQSDKRFRLIEGDIRNLDTCMEAAKDVQCVFHEAALGSVPRSIENPVLTNDININGFLNVLLAAKENNVERFIFASSSSVYGDDKSLPKIEEITGKLLSPYAVSKKTGEHYATVFGDLFGIKTLGLRYFNVFGPSQDPNGPYAAVIPKFIKLLCDGKRPVINGDGSQTRDFTFVNNVVDANVLALKTNNENAFGRILNIACGDKTGLVELFELIRDSLAETYPTVREIDPEFGPERKGDIAHSLASIKKAQELLGYFPEINVKDGIAETVKWFLKQ